jgi:hypothetical protein
MASFWLDATLTLVREPARVCACPSSIVITFTNSRTLGSDVRLIAVL